MILRPTSMQKSPRMVPGSDAAGFVAPADWDACKQSSGRVHCYERALTKSCHDIGLPKLECTASFVLMDSEACQILLGDW
jgi:hypothetical protein